MVSLVAVLLQLQSALPDVLMESPAQGSVLHRCYAVLVVGAPHDAGDVAVVRFGERVHHLLPEAHSGRAG